MRFLMACMLLCGAAVGYSQEESTEEVTVVDEGDNSSVAAGESFSAQMDWDCGCNKGNKPK